MKMSAIEQHIYDLIELSQTPRQQPTTEPFLSLMDRLGNPHLRLPKVIHVAGTNGKGSVVANINSILQTAGYIVSRYTSPHLVSICERIQISNKLIREEQFLKTLKTVIVQTHGLPLTFFDIITAVAFIEFADNPVDFLLLETGIGGQYDSTNVVESPILTIIAQIGLDHVDILGHSLVDITKEKAGIIKQNCPIITLNHPSQVLDIIQSKALEKQAPLHIAHTNKTYDTGLHGEHQQQNASLAATAISVLGICDENIILQGIKNTSWPGRMQKIQVDGRNIWIDMAHNASAAKVAVKAMQQMKNTPFHLVFSMRASKDASTFLGAFKDHIESATYIPLPEYANGHKTDHMTTIAKEHGIKLHAASTIKDALQNLTSGPVLATGSAVLLGEALQLSLDA